MLVCPDCREVLGEYRDFDRRWTGPASVDCKACDWKGAMHDRVFHAIRSKCGHTHLGYQDFYEQLAKEDLSSPIMEQEYAAALNESTALAVGDVRGKYGCDLGVGKGHLLRMMLHRGAAMTAVDIALAYLEALNGSKRLRRVQADAEDLPFRDEFDFVTCTDVMEHVLNPGNLLYCINDALKPGGVAAIRVPADENLLLYSTHLGCKYEMVHLRTFSEDVFRRMLQGAGFSVHSIESDGHSLSMLLPKACDESVELQKEVNQVRSLLIRRGVTTAELMKTPLWFKSHLSKPYVFLAIVEKTHRIVPSASHGFALEPIK